MGRTLLSDAFDVGVLKLVSPLLLVLQWQVWVRHSYPTLLTLGLILRLILILRLLVWVGHSCPTLLTLGLALTLGLLLKL